MNSAASDMLFSQAIQYLTGQGVPRDVARARTLLRSAADAGHDDAALFEVSLAANGSGGPRDWPGALARLRETAARGSPAAQEYLRIIEAMAIDGQGMSLSLPEPEVLSEKPAVVRYRGLLTPIECQIVANAVVDILEPAVVADPVTGRPIAHAIRTSDSAVVGPTRECLPVAAINRRLAAISGTDFEQGESLAVLRYRPGQQYRLHHDALPGAINQRIATVLVYLNDGYVGGETVFPDLGVRVAGRAGDALVFDNLDAQGQADPLGRHAGMPVTQGVKWLATRWIRQSRVDPWDQETWR